MELFVVYKLISCLDFGFGYGFMIFVMLDVEIGLLFFVCFYFVCVYFEYLFSDYIIFVIFE